MNIEATLRLGKENHGTVGCQFKLSGMNKMRLSYIFRHNDVNIYNGGSRDFNMTYNYHAVDFSVFDFNIRNFNVNLGRVSYYNYHDVLIGTHTDVDFDHLSDEHYFSIISM